MPDQRRPSSGKPGGPSGGVTIPHSAPCERYAKLREVFSPEEFVQHLNSTGVFIRLDERGGADEPVPWAFRGSGLPIPQLPPDNGDGDDVFLDRATEGDTHDGPTEEGNPSASQATANQSTVTGPSFQLSIPAARGRATAHVVPRKELVVVGRTTDADVRVNERSISKRHVQLECGDASATAPMHAGSRVRSDVFVLDLKSQNGTRINGVSLLPHARHLLNSGDVLDLGDVALLFLSVAAFYDGLPRICTD